MTEKKVRGVMIPRHDIEKNWDLAVNFKPAKGELIVYDTDETNLDVRFKFGDGETVCKDLPFATAGIKEDDLEEFKCIQYIYTVTERDVDARSFQFHAFETTTGEQYDGTPGDNFLLFQDGVLLNKETHYSTDKGLWEFTNGVLTDGNILTLVVFSGNLITVYSDNGGGSDVPTVVVGENIEGKTLELSNTTQYEELEVKMVPKKFVYGTPAPDSTGNIASGISYRISTDDDDKPGSADYKAGQSLEASGKASFAVGCNNKSTTNYSSTFGSHNINSSYGGLVAGTYNIALGKFHLGGGDTEDKNSQYSTMVGRNGVASAHLTFVEGDSTKNGFKEYGSEIEFRHITHSADASEYLFGENGLYDKWLAKGRNFAVALGDFSHVGGLNSVAGHSMTFAYGESVFAGGQGSTAFGKHTQAKGSRSFVIGSSNVAEGNNSFAMGISTNAIGNQSFSGGTDSVATGEDSFAFGENVTASERLSMAFGWKSNASGEGAVAFGQSNSVSGNYAFTAGGLNEATGNFSASFGYSHETSGDYSFAVGFDNAATGNNSFVAGNRAFANYENSVAIGYNVTSSAQNQIVVGQNNVSITDGTTNSKKATFIVGVGTDSKYANGFVVYRDGHAEVETQGTNAKSVVIKDTLDKTLESYAKKITYGTVAPTGGNDGDIYIQIVG